MELRPVLFHLRFPGEPKTSDQKTSRRDDLRDPVCCVLLPATKAVYDPRQDDDGSHAVQCDSEQLDSAREISDLVDMVRSQPVPCGKPATLVVLGCLAFFGLA